MISLRFLRLPVLAAAAFVFTSLAGTTQLHGQALPDKPVVKGTFLGDGKDAKIQYLVVQAREPFSDQAAIRLIFTEKNPSASKKPDFDAAFKRLGSALIISVHKDGGIFGCEVAHTAHPKSPFSAIGEIKTADFKVTDTHVSGRIITGKELDAFGQKWNVDLTFSAPLPKGAFTAAEPAPESKSKMAAKDKEKEDDKPEAPAGPAIPIADLPLPATARDIEYKAIVEQIAFSSDASVSIVANDFSAKLKQKGWKDTPGSLIGKTNAILKRKQGAAALTIMVQPAGKGCNVKVFAEGLDWTNTPASTAAAVKPPSLEKDAADLEAEANRLLQEALKGVPKF